VCVQVIKNDFDARCFAVVLREFMHECCKIMFCSAVCHLGESFSCFKLDSHENICVTVTITIKKILTATIVSSRVTPCVYEYCLQRFPIIKFFY